MNNIDNALDKMDKLVKRSDIPSDVIDEIVKSRQEFYLFYYKIFMLTELLKTYRYTRSITQAHDICEYLLEILELNKKEHEVRHIPVKDYYEIVR